MCETKYKKETKIYTTGTLKKQKYIQQHHH